MFHSTKVAVEIQEYNLIPEHSTSIEQSSTHQNSFQTEVIDQNEKIKDTEGLLSPNKANRTIKGDIFEADTPYSDNAVTLKHLPQTCHKERSPSEHSDNDD